MRKMRRWILAVVATGVVGVLAGIWGREWLGARVWSSMARRRDAFWRYEVAFDFFRESGKPLPSSLLEVVNTYNATPYGSEDPIQPRHPMPEYRFAGSLCASDGPYLVLADRPAHWYDPLILVAYAYPSGEFVRVEWLNGEQLRQAIAEDDQRRAKSTTTAASRKSENAGMPSGDRLR